MLDLDAKRAEVPPREAATLLLVRQAPSAGAIEIFCVVRHQKSGFLGGAVVFPGGKVDASDRDAEWAALAHGVPRFSSTDDDATARAFGIAACREALEEAAILLATGSSLRHEDVVALRTEVSQGGGTLRDALRSRNRQLDLTPLHPFGRWVTPIAEARRFDTRFFLACAPDGQRGAHDAHETTASFWASPVEILGRFDRREIQLAPPTHRSLELLRGVSTTARAVELAATLGVEPICPKLVPEGDTLALVLPGDAEHDITTARVPGASRFVLHGERWLPSGTPR